MFARHTHVRGGKYEVKLLDRKGFTIGAERWSDTLRDARRVCSWMLGDEFARACETTHAILGTYQVAVYDAAGECVYDQMHPQARAEDALRLADDGESLQLG